MNLSTLGKKFKAPEITEEDRIRAAVEVKKNTVKQSVVELWQKLKVRRGGEEEERRGKEGENVEEGSFNTRHH